MESIEIDGKSFEAVSIPSSKANILLIKGSQGFLGCSYFDIDTADVLGEAVAIVTGVANYDDMLDAKVVRVSGAARELGVREGMCGRESLSLFN